MDSVLFLQTLGLLLEGLGAGCLGLATERLASAAWGRAAAVADVGAAGTVWSVTPRSLQLFRWGWAFFAVGIIAQLTGTSLAVLEP